MRSINLSRNLSIILLAVTSLGLLAACSATPNETSQPPETEVPTMAPTESVPTEADEHPSTGTAHSSKARDLSPNISPSELQELAAGNRAFAVDLYQAIRTGDENLFFSPYSIALALAMTYGGARTQTAQEMAATLHFTLPDEAIHTGFNALDLELVSRNNEGDEMMPGFKLNIANSAWAQYDRPFEQDYLDLLAENYEAGLFLTDYVNDPEGSRLAINEWVSNETESKIEDLLQPGTISSLTRLVLANAIYFNAGWQNTFDEALTEEAPFTLLDGNQISVPMMSTSGPEHFGYAAEESYQAVELPYNGGQLSMVILLPKTGAFETVEASLEAETLTDLLANLETKQIEL